jgi:ferritin-like protein
MPQTEKGKKILANMIKQYGSEKGREVYYASIVKGKVKGAEGKGGTGKLAKAKATYAREHKGAIMRKLAERKKKKTTA